jgi:cell division protein FtsW (lipid II flippase)
MKLNSYYKTFFIACIILGIIVVVLQASRGSFLAIGTAIIIQLLFSKTKLHIKLAFISVTLIGIIYMYQSDYFTLLIDRVQNDEGTGSGRSEIWIRKINDWSSNLSNILGGGFQSSIYKFAPLKADCHNEFVSILLNYGVIGIGILFASIYKLCRVIKNRVFNLSLIAFICIAFMTLSPFSCETGWIACPFLILLLYKYIELNNREAQKETTNI